MKVLKKRISLLILILTILFLYNNCSDNNQYRKEEVVNPKHTIISVNPISGVEGSTVSITGSHFGDNPSDIAVKFNGSLAEQITLISNNQISAIVPSGSSTGPVSVTIKSTTVESTFDFTINEISVNPTITELSSASEFAGTMITITGTNFGNDASSLSVKFNGVEVNEITLVSTTQITVLVPVGASSGPVTVAKMGVKTAIGPNFRVKTPVNFKIAFLGDSDIGINADAVLELIKAEEANLVVHPGDLNYSEIPQDFEDNINGILGIDFPYFYSVGNHDDTVWNGDNGYQSFLEGRFQRLGIPWKGQLGVLSSFSFHGIFFVASAPDEFEISTTTAGEHIHNELSTSSSIWNISFWHKNQRRMQIGLKGNEAGWDVYDESRKGGAIIATAHEHSYCRTYEMENFKEQTISSTDNTINLAKDDPSTSLDEGRSFAFVSGLGGKNIREAQNGLENNPWWADVYHSGNGAQYGALFGEFNYNGDESLARFYFKDIDGRERDLFFVRSKN